MATLRRFAAAQRGVAVVEFALVVPVLLVLYLGSIEASSLYTVDRRITTISSTLGDLVSRADGELEQSDLDDYFDAAAGILIPYSTTGLQQVVSLISVAADGRTSVKWSRTPAGGTARTIGSTYPLAATAQMNQIARDVGYLVVSETSYAYTPVLGVVIKGPINLYRESFYMPRFAECIKVTGSTCPS
jgi:Flp pilus assembly protein TadG